MTAVLLQRSDQAENGRMQLDATLDAWFLAVQAETTAPLHFGQGHGLHTSGID